VFLKSGIGEEAYVPRVTLEHGSGGVSALRGSQQQAEVLLVQGAVDRLLRRAAVPPRLIDVLIVNSGVFNPTPSLASLLVSRFGMRPDVKSYHLAGMGCSASLISVDLAARIFRAARRPRAARLLRYALIVSTEVLPELYDGRDRSMMVTNCLFRCAASALLLSCSRSDRQLSKLQLSRHGIIRVNLAADDAAHNVVVVREDDHGIVGAKLHPDLINVATRAIRINITRLAPHVLPLPELLNAGLHLIIARLFPNRTSDSSCPAPSASSAPGAISPHR
jgi:3-ketoacyl-CoA synthase